MKYIKTYEEVKKFDLKYKVGDYVILNLERLNKNYKGFKDLLANNKNVARIYKINIYDERINEFFPYMIKFYRWEFNEDFYLGNDYDIIRKATPEEIERYEMETDADKYNL